MKRLPIISVSALAAILACSCVALKKVNEFPDVQLSLTEKMQKNDDILPVRMSVTIPQEFNNLNTGIEVRPVLLGSDTVSQRVVLDPMIIEGPIHDRFNERMDHYKPEFYDQIQSRNRYQKNESGVYDYIDDVPYQAWFGNASLYADLYANAYNKKVYLGRVYVGHGLLDFMPFADVLPEQYYYHWLNPGGKTPVIGGSDQGGSTKIIFPLASANTSDNSGKDALENYMKHVFSDPEVKSYSVEAIIANSPEGTLKYNQKLSQKRKKAVGDYLKSLNIPENHCSYVLIDEDWEKMSEMLETAGLKNLDGIRDLINNEKDVDVREHAIRDKYYFDWKKIRKDIYPKLRRADIVVETVYKGVAGKERIHTEDGFYFAKNDEKAVYEAHARMLDEVKEENFEAAADIARGLPLNDMSNYALSNVGIVFMMAGDFEEARYVLERVEGVPQAEYNLALAYLLCGDYEKAEQHFNPYCCINSAIAKLYLGKNQEAYNVLKVLSASPKRDYLAAVAAMRMGDRELALKYIHGAAADRSLLEKMASEPDFFPLRDTREFIEIIK